MTHEFVEIIDQVIKAKKEGLKTVLASVVDLDGSSYRRPGVRMLINENGSITGAVSGGCVEKEVCIQAESVFNTGQSKIMTYDGRYRLGCEGVLYILIELVQFSESFFDTFYECIENRSAFRIISNYDKKEGFSAGIGSSIILNNNKLYPINSLDIIDTKKESSLLLQFKQIMPPRFKLVIIGAEHDAVKLCKYAALTGWEITIVSNPSEGKLLINFPGAKALQNVSPEELDVTKIDSQTAVVLMTHNFAKDLRYLIALEKTKPAYIGILGPVKRREDLLNQFIEYSQDISDKFLDLIHGPAGIDIGAETPQEIAVSIVSEILAIIRKKDTLSLSKKAGRIHI